MSQQDIARERSRSEGEMGDKPRSPGSSTASWIVLGVSQILEALQFLNGDCGLVHGNVTPDTIFVTESGDWKLGGMDLVGEYDNPRLMLSRCASMVPSAFLDPERQSQRWRGGSTAWSTDVWSLAAVAHHAANVTNSPLPSGVESCLKKMASSKARKRPEPRRLLRARCFMADPFVSAMREIRNWQIMDPDKRVSFFKRMAPLVETFPKAACRHKILPVLLEAIRIAEKDTDANMSSVALAPLLTIGASMENAKDFNELIIPPVVRLYGSNNRAVRLQLLRHAQSVIPKLPENIVNERIFSDMIGGFTDKVPAIREWTIRSMIHVVPLLNDGNKARLLENFRRLVRDPLPPIRNNVIVCLSLVAHMLPQMKVSLQLYAAASRDPVPSIRKAALGGLQQIGPLLSMDIRARSVLPMVVTMLVDPDDDVRKMAFELASTSIRELKTYVPPKPKIPTANIGTMSGDRGDHTKVSGEPSRTPRRNCDVSSSSESHQKSERAVQEQPKRSTVSTSRRSNEDFFDDWEEDSLDKKTSTVRSVNLEERKRRKMEERKQKAAQRREKMRERREERRREKKRMSSTTQSHRLKVDDEWENDIDASRTSERKERIKRGSKTPPTKKMGAMKLGSSKAKKKTIAMKLRDNDKNGGKKKSHGASAWDFDDIGDEDGDGSDGGSWGDW